MAALTSTFSRVPALSPLTVALTVAGALCLASMLLDRVKAQAETIRAHTEAQAATSLAQAGFPWVRLQIDDDLGRVLGTAPNEVSRAQALQAASRLLAPAMGWPGVFARLEDGQRVAASMTSALPAMAPAARASADPSTASTASTHCATMLAEAQGVQRIVFDSGAIEPTAASLQLLDRLVPLLMACGGGKLEVQGHSDALGAAAPNKRLSLRRAQAVAAALTARGVPAARLGAEGLGASRLLDEAGTPEAHARNRRIEFHWAVQPA